MQRRERRSLSRSATWPIRRHNISRPRRRLDLRKKRPQPRHLHNLKMRQDRMRLHNLKTRPCHQRPHNRRTSQHHRLLHSRKTRPLRRMGRDRYVSRNRSCALLHHLRLLSNRSCALLRLPRRLLRISQRGIFLFLPARRLLRPRQFRASRRYQPGRASPSAHRRQPDRQFAQLHLPRQDHRGEKRRSISRSTICFRTPRLALL